MKAAELWKRFPLFRSREDREAFFRELHRGANVALGGRSPHLKRHDEDVQSFDEIYAGRDWRRLAWVTLNIGERH